MSKRPSKIETTLEEPQAERAVLASVLIDPARASILDELSPKAFARLEHRSVYDAMQRVRKRGEAVDLITLAAELRSLGRFEDVGGMAFLAGLDLDLPDRLALDSYLDILRDRRLRREAKETLERAAAELGRNGQPSAEQLRGIREDLLEIELEATENAFEEWGPLIRTSVTTALEGRLEVAMSTGFYDLDRWLYGGFRAGQLVTIAAATGKGKTIFASQVAWHVAGEMKKPAAYIAFEMSKEEMALRIFSSVSGVALSNLYRGHISERVKDSAKRFAADMEDAPLYISDSCGGTPQHVAAICRRLKDTGGLSLVVVDYLQLMHSDGKHDNRNLEIAAISRSLKQLARELKVPVLMLSQFSRGTAKEKRAPELHDLRDSGAIEQDSDIVIALHREKETDSTYDVRILKQRNGSPGVVNLRFDGPCVRFQNMSEREETA